MSWYISSNENRFYAQIESAYGQVAAITEANRFPAVKLSAKQVPERVIRKDKTGGRTFMGMPAGIRKQTTFEAETYLTSWDDQTREPAYGPLFRGVMGQTPSIWGGATVQATPAPTTIQFSAPHGLGPGQAIAFGGEIRFVSAIADAATVIVNAPFSIQPSAGTAAGSTITYRLSTELPSATLFDYWQTGGVHRILHGIAVNQLTVKVNSDFHGFDFKGYAADVVDSASFSGGEAGLTTFPDEPQLSPLNYSVVPGHMGQAWLGSSPEQFFTLTSAELSLDNGIDMRNREFGSYLPRSINPGRRTVSLNMSLFEQPDTATAGLYQAARQRSPISAMFQLGQDPGQLFGVYLKSVVAEVPEYDDSQTRLQWKFTNCRAQGTGDDELVVAFA